MSDLLNSASLVLIPSGYKEDTVYSVVPSDGSGDLSFTRASNGTRVNSAGLVEVCPWNLLQYSEDLSNAIWTKSNSPTMTYDIAVAPNGTMTADGIQDISGSGYKSVYQIITGIAPNSTFTLSVYVKKETSETNYGGISMYYSGATAKFVYGIFNAVNGTINFASGTLTPTYQIVSVGNYWRIELTTTDTGSNTQLLCEYYGTLSTNGTALGTGVGSVRTLWGFQTNIGSTAKPYFPTTDRLNVPRLTYQNGGGGCPSLLLEKQSTNFVKYSQDFTQSDWTQSGATITANAIVSPDGTQNATRVQFSAGSRYVYQTIGGSGIAAGSVTISCWIKGASVQKIGFSDGNANPNEITLTTDWQRYTFTFPYSSGGIGVQFDNYFGVTPSAQTKDFYIWGAQSEQSSYPTSYIPTTSASATRVIDDCRKTGISSLIGQTEGTMFIDLNLTAWDSNSFYFGLYGGGNEIYFRCAGTGAIDFVHYFGATQAFITKSGLSLGRHKLAACYKNNDWAFYVDGILVGTDTSGTFSGTISQMVFGYTSISAYPPFQSVNQTILFPTRLTNAELASLTTI
jgi:hypothetical protein